MLKGVRELLLIKNLEQRAQAFKIYLMIQQETRLQGLYRYRSQLRLRADAGYLWLIHLLRNADEQNLVFAVDPYVFHHCSEFLHSANC